jgi:PAS domain S-box-containing protein/putative nucleotidyltransferase with HDIG domain
MISQAELSALRGQQENPWIFGKGNRPLLDNASEGITVVQDGMMRLANPGLLILTGYSEQELISRPFTDFIHPDDRQMVMAIYLKKLKGEEPPYASAFRVIAKGGSVRWTEMKTALFTWEGKPAVCCSMSDITERRKVEQALADSEKRYRFLAENVSDVIWVIDMNLRPTYLSPSITKMTGYSVEETMARGLEKGLTPASIEAVSEIVMRELARKGEPNTATRLTPVAVEIEHKDGSKIWAESAGTLLRGSDGQPVEIIGILHDITEHKKAEETLQRREQRFQALTEHSSDVILIVSAEGTVRYASPSLEPVLGFKLEEAIGTSILEYIHQETIRLVADDFARLLQNPGATMQTQIRVQHKDGTWRTLEGTATNLLHDPAVEGIVINYRDITERKKAEESLRESAEIMSLFVKHSPVYAFIKDVAPDRSRVLVASENLKDLTGVAGSQMSGKTMEELFPPEFAAKITADDWAVVSGGKVLHLDETLGNRYYITIKFPIVIGSKKLLAGYTIDVTERKKAETALQDSERRSRLLAGSASDVIWVTDMKLRVTYVSPSVTSLFGYSVEEAMAGGLAQGLTPASLEAATADLAKALAEKGEPNKATELPRQEIEVRRKDGSTAWAESRSIFIRGPDGQPVEIIGVLHDITERKRADQAMRDSEARYRLLAENLSDVIWTMDTNLKYTYVSPSVTHMRGYTVEEAMAQPLEDNLTLASAEAAMRIMAEEDAKEHTGQYDPNRTITMEVELYRKDGSTVWAENAVTYLRDSSGQVTGYLGVSRDITESREATKQLERSFRNLERAMNGTVQAIALTVESRDRYTAGHQKRVAQLGCAIARKLGFTSDQIQAIRIAGLLHDIGKISVPQEILSKPVKLTDIEFRLIKAHSQTGYDILKSVEFPWPIADIVVQHHERMNGSGYPSAIREDKLLMEARILGVADVVEAMSSHRPYRAPLGIDKALEEISRNSGILYDPSVVDACVWVFSEEGFEFED